MGRDAGDALRGRQRPAASRHQLGWPDPATATGRTGRAAGGVDTALGAWFDGSAAHVVPGAGAALIEYPRDSGNVWALVNIQGRNGTLWRVDPDKPFGHWSTPHELLALARYEPAAEAERGLWMLATMFSPSWRTDQFKSFRRSSARCVPVPSRSADAQS